MSSRALWPEQRAPCVLVESATPADGVELLRRVRARAPELIGAADARRWRARSTARAACSSGRRRATAFGDYVAGSNHMLPTGGLGALRLGARHAHFRRRMAEVRIATRRRCKLAPAGVPIARAEGFPVHADARWRPARRTSWTIRRNEPHGRDRAHDPRDRRHAALDLDGSGAGTRSTGVGFLDHMLDLLARHGAPRPRRAR